MRTRCATRWRVCSKNAWRDLRAAPTAASRNTSSVCRRYLTSRVPRLPCCACCCCALRGRSERLHHFEALDDVQSALQKLMQREPPLAKVLPRQPGTKESRYAHLLAGDVVEFESPVQAGAAAERSPAEADRMARLQEEVADLRREVSEVKDQLERFRR